MMQELKKKKINKNFPCPCGSGKKYKDCCQIKNIEKEETLKKEIKETNELYYQHSNSIKNKKNLIIKLISIASEFIKENKITQAKILYQKCLKISLKHNYPEVESACKIILDTIDNTNKPEYEIFSNENVNLDSKAKQNKIDFELDFIISLAENYKKKGLSRESAYFFEEAFWGATKSNNKNKQALALSKLGNLLNKSNGYNDAKTFYNLIFFARPRKIDFGCSSTGACCKEFIININLKDVIDVLKNRPDLKIEDFVNFNQEEELTKYLTSQENRNLDSKVLSFKKKNNHCLFLEDNKCSIYNFRPAVCRNWPLILDNEGYTLYQRSMHFFMKSHCNYCIIPNRNNEEEIEKSLKYYNYYSFFKEIDILESLIQKKYFTNIEKVVEDKKYLNDEIFEILINFAYKQDNFLNKISQTFSKISKVAKVITSYFLKDYFDNSIVIGVYTIGNVSETIDLLYESLNDEYQENIKIIEFNNKKHISIFIDDNFKSEIYVYYVDEIDNKILPDEIILFEKKELLPPKKKKKISIPEDIDVYAEILKSAKTIIKYELKQKNIIKAKEALENIIAIYKNTVDNNNIELADFINEKFLDIQDIYLSEIETFLSLDEYHSELELFINYLNNFNDNNILFDYSCKNLIYLHKTNSDKLFSLIQEIEPIILNLDYENKKIFINNIFKEHSILDRFTEQKTICKLLLDSYEVEEENLTLDEKIEYLKIILDKYTPDDTENFEKKYKSLLIDFITYSIKSHKIENIQPYLENLLNKIEKNKEKFEFLLEIGDLYLEENYKKEAIQIYQKALNSSSGHYYINDKLVILQIIIDLNIQIGEYKQAEHFIKKLIKSSEKYEKEHTKIYAILNLLKINYLTDNKNIDTLKFIKDFYIDSDNNEMKFILYRYFENSIAEKLQILTEDLKDITKTLFNFIPEINDERKQKRTQILKFLKNIKDVLIFTLELYYVSFILSNLDLNILNDEIVNLHLNAMICNEFNDIKRSSLNIENLIQIYLDYPNKDLDLFSFFILYLGNLSELQDDNTKAKECFIEASNISKIEINKNICSIYKVYIDFINNINTTSFVFLSEFYERLIKQLSSINLDSDNDIYIRDLIKTMQNLEFLKEENI